MGKLLLQREEELGDYEDANGHERTLVSHLGELDDATMKK